MARKVKATGIGWHLPPFSVELVATTASQAADWGITDLKVPAAWALSKGDGVKVAVLDTGIDAQHPDLRDALLEAKDFTGSQRGFGDVNGHGTHCGGTIAARDNDTGCVGVAPLSRLLVGKVLGDNGSGSGTQVAAGIRWAVSRGADLISMSLGSSQPDQTILKAVREAVAAGIPVICAAGNEGPGANTVGYPGRWPETVAVAAMNQAGQVSRFSSRGPEVDVAAPGEKILSTWPGGGVAVLSGTSMATPFVAGCVALLMSLRKANGADKLTPAEVLAVLKAASKDVGAPGFDPDAGWGLIDPVTLLGPVTPTPPPSGGERVLEFTGDELAKVKLVFKR